MQKKKHSTSLVIREMQIKNNDIPLVTFNKKDGQKQDWDIEKLEPLYVRDGR